MNAPLLTKAVSDRIIARMKLVPKYKPLGRAFAERPAIRPLSFEHIQKWRMSPYAAGMSGPGRLVDYFEFHSICIVCLGVGCVGDSKCPVCSGIVHPYRVLNADHVVVVRTSVTDRYYCCEVCLLNDPHSDQAEPLRAGEIADQCNECERFLNVQKAGPCQSTTV